MKTEQTKVIGSFLMYYYEDLNYIKMFQDFKENKISENDYVIKKAGTFYSFLIDFKVVRNFAKGKTDELLSETIKFINNDYANNVDLFAENLAETGLTRGNKTTSLASKILFLNNPWDIIPMDTLTRKAFNQNENTYSIYLEKLDYYRRTNKTIIEECLHYTNPLTIIIENEFKDKLRDLNIIRENRIVDKLLWTS